MAINLSNILKQAQQGGKAPKRSIGGVSSYSPNTGTVLNNPMNATLPQNASMGEATRFLYDTRLQNVFNDYQQSVASLQQAEQNQLQNAYYIRELSKKYLGEYASNVGIGDVSGNLMDIYGSYQKNVTSIQQQSEGMKLSLQQTFDEKSQAAFEGAIASQLQAEQIQLDANANTALFNITKGDTGGQQWDVYLQSQLDSGAISQESYQVLYSKVYTAKLGEVEANFDRNFFGMKIDAEGNRVPITKEEYIESNKSWLSSTDYQKLKDFALMGNTGELGIKSVDKFEWFDLFGLGGSGFSFEITDEDGNVLSFATAPGDVDNDPQAKSQVSAEELTEAFEKEEGTGLLIAGQTTFEYKGNYYYYVETSPLEGATWYRAINYTATAQMYENLMDPKKTDQSKWNFKAGGNILVTQQFSYDKQEDILTLTTSGKEMEYDTDWEANDQLVFNSATNTYARTGLNDEVADIFKQFVIQHGGGAADESGLVPKNKFSTMADTVIFYKGTFYTLDHRGHLRRFKLK